jgi:hypothetical protein
MRTFSVVAAQDTPSYGSFTIEAEDPGAALAAAKATLLVDSSGLNEPELDAAHSLRIVSLQENDEDPLFWDVSLDPDAPLWPGGVARRALLSTTSLLAQVLVSLGEVGEYRAELDQLETNLRLLAFDTAGCEPLLAARADATPDAWAERVMVWSLDPSPRAGS